MSYKNDNQKTKITGNKAVALCGVFIALALILSYLENLVPVTFVVPGIKLGLANLVTIITLIKLGFKPALIVSTGRIILSGILFGNVTIIIYSLAGAFLSIVCMLIVSKIKLFTVTGISVCGAIAHNVGQIIVAAFIMENAKILYYLLVLVATGTIAGFLIGIIAGNIIKNIRL